MSHDCEKYVMMVRAGEGAGVLRVCVWSTPLVLSIAQQQQDQG